MSKTTTCGPRMLATIMAAVTAADWAQSHTFGLCLPARIDGICGLGFYSFHEPDFTMLASRDGGTAG